MRHRLAPLIALACLARPAAAELYSDRDLALVTPSMQANIALMVHDNIAAALPPAQRPRVRSIEVVFPRDGDNPLAFWTQPGRNAIYVPLSSVAVEDKAVAARLLRLIELLDSNDDVQDIYANYDMPCESLVAADGAAVAAVAPRALVARATAPATATMRDRRI